MGEVVSTVHVAANFMLQNVGIGARHAEFSGETSPNGGGKTAAVATAGRWSVGAVTDGHL